MSAHLISTLLWIVAIWVLVDALIVVVFLWPDQPEPNIGEPPRDPSDPRTVFRNIKDR